MTQNHNLKDLPNITEKKAFWSLRPEHRGWRVAYFNLLVDNMVIEDDFYVPVEEVLFDTTILADDLLKYLINNFNFKVKKKIKFYRPRKEGQVMTVEEYLQTIKEDSTLFYSKESDYRIVVSESSSAIKVAIL